MKDNELEEIEKRKRKKEEEVIQKRKRIVRLLAIQDEFPGPYKTQICPNCKKGLIFEEVSQFYTCEKCGYKWKQGIRPCLLCDGFLVPWEDKKFRGFICEKCGDKWPIRRKGLLGLFGKILEPPLKVEEPENKWVCPECGKMLVIEWHINNSEDIIFTFAEGSREYLKDDKETRIIHSIPDGVWYHFCPGCKYEYAEISLNVTIDRIYHNDDADFG